jgi:hypothetical protein
MEHVFMVMTRCCEPWSETMRKFSMLALASAAALAVAVPASAQPGFGGYDGRSYDGRGYDGRGYDGGRYRGGSQRLMAEINQLYGMVDRDMRMGLMTKNQAKKYFRRLDRDRELLNRDRRDGYLHPDTERNVAREVAELQRAYREFQRQSRYDRRW